MPNQFSPRFRARVVEPVGQPPVLNSTHACLTMGARFALTHELAMRYAVGDTIVATFTNPQASHFALNWALGLQSIGLKSLVGMSDRLGSRAEAQLHAADAGLFCADGKAMRRNGQAGRWAEVGPLLRHGFNVLLSDSDIGWLRDPMPYFSAARRAHPSLDFALLTDRVFNDYSSGPLPDPQGQPTPAAPKRFRLGRALLDAEVKKIPAKSRDKSLPGVVDARSISVDLDLEHAGASQMPSLNIGVIFFYKHALRQCEQMIAKWAAVVVDPASGKLSTWDQDPINKHVLQRTRGHGSDSKLLFLHEFSLSMGVLPMLQFTTSFTYFMLRKRRADLGAVAYCVHAIFAHGKDEPRKRAILRDSMAWHDPPSYYSEGRYLRFETAVPHQLRLEGGFGIVQAQIDQFVAAMKLAIELNRTLILPRFRCDERAMAYPCYAWYHRAMGYFGFNFFQKITMPDYCPPYYWLDASRLQSFPWPTREPTFLVNPRTPASVTSSVATLRLCPKGQGGRGCSLNAAATSASATPEGGAVAGASEVHHPSHTTLAALRRAMEPLSAARVLTVQHLHALNLPPSHPPAYARALGEISHTMWCTPCPITRRGAVISEVNRSVLRELEHFCRTEARGRLGYPGYRQHSCCSQHGRCHTCSPGERGTTNESLLPWHVKTWISRWARLQDPPEYRGAYEAGWRCRHPLCTGSDRTRYP